MKQIQYIDPNAFAPKDAWGKLSLAEKSAMIEAGVANGFTRLSDIKRMYNAFMSDEPDTFSESVIGRANSSDADFVQRLKDPDRQAITDWETGGITTHKLSVGTDEEGNNYIYPEVQDIDGRLIDFTRPPYDRYAGRISAEERGDTVRVSSLNDAIEFTQNYKQYYPKGNTFQVGGQKEKVPTIDSAFMATNPSPWDIAARAALQYSNREFGHEFPVKQEEQVPTEPAPLNLEEIKRRQRFMETGFRDNLTSPVGAKGRYQVTDNTLAEYTKKTGKTGDLFDPVFNEQVRDWYMNEDLEGRSWITKGEPSDSVKYAKKLAAYNYGPTNTVRALNRAKNAGADIYNSWEWLKFLPKETQDYINFIERNKDVTKYKNQAEYEKTLKKLNRKDKGGPLVQAANEFRRGGKKRKQVQEEVPEDDYIYMGMLPDVDITAKEMPEWRKKWRRAWNMPIMVPATAPNPSSIASYQYNPSNLMQTTPKQEMDYLAGLAVPIAPYLTSGYFLGTGVGDMAQNGISVGNSVQVGLSALPFAPYVSKYAPAVVDKGLSLFGNKKAKIRNIGRTFEKSISDNYLEVPLNAWAIENVHTKAQTVPSIKDVNFNIETTLSPESPYYNWEVFVNNQNNRYDAAEKAIEEGKRLYTNLIESPEYLQRIKDNLRIDNLKGHYEYTKRNRPSSPNDYVWRHNEGDAIERFNKEYAERLEDSRIRDLKSTEAEEILKRIKGVNDQKRDIVLQDKIQYIDNNGNLVSPEGLAGMYLHNKETGTRKIYLDVTVPDIAHTYMHEHGGHGTYRELSFLDFSDQFGRNLDMEPNIGLYNNGKWLTPELVKYYKDFDEARARTIPVLAKMKNEGYKLSYNGFKKYLKDHKLNEGHLGLGYYDEKTIRHLINTIYGGTGIIIGASKFDNNLQTLDNKDE